MSSENIRNSKEPEWSMELAAVPLKRWSRFYYCLRFRGKKRIASLKWCLRWNPVSFEVCGLFGCWQFLTHGAGFCSGVCRIRPCPLNEPRRDAWLDECRMRKGKRRSGWMNVGVRGSYLGRCRDEIVMLTLIWAVTWLPQKIIFVKILISNALEFNYNPFTFFSLVLISLWIM